MHGGPLLTIEDLRFRYAETSPISGPVLDGLSLTIGTGGTHVLFGSADAGKTTLARILAGLVPRFTGGVLRGRVAVTGIDLGGVPPFDRLHLVGLVAQDSEEQLLTTRCDTEVAFALESLGMPRAEIRRRVSESLALLGLSGFDARNPTSLSGGERKRLLIACLAAVSPRIWVLDEALGELDFEWKGKALDLIANAGGTILLLESRWSPLAAQRGSSCFLLQGGRISAGSRTPGDRRFGAALVSAGMQPDRKKRRGPPRVVPAIEGLCLWAENLEFRFDRSLPFTLRVGRLELGAGEICALVGRNGSGKSTLGRVLCGLIKPQGGSVGFGNGRTPATPEQLMARVGYLFQNPDHQIFLPTVREELALGLRAAGVEGKELRLRVERAAERFRLPDLEEPPALMGYGARRRLQAATYYLLSRDLLILDEVDTGLSYREVRSLIEALASQVPSMLLITHDLALAREAAHRVRVMDSGVVLDEEAGQRALSVAEAASQETLA